VDRCEHQLAARIAHAPDLVINGVDQDRSLGERVGPLLLALSSLTPMAVPWRPKALRRR